MGLLNRLRIRLAAHTPLERQALNALWDWGQAVTIYNQSQATAADLKTLEAIQRAARHYAIAIRREYDRRPGRQ